MIFCYILLYFDPALSFQPPILPLIFSESPSFSIVHLGTHWYPLKIQKSFLKNGKKYVCEKKWAYKHFSHLLQWKLPQHCWHPTARLQQCNPSIHWSPPQGSAMSVSVLSSSIIIVEHSKKELGIETKLGTSKWQVTIKNYDWLTCILNQFRSHYQHNSHYRPY